MSINEWPLEDRPREKLLAQGALTLSDAELLAILIGSGTKGHSAVDVARDVLIKSGGLRSLLNRNAQDLPYLKGIGKATFARIQAALELSRRYLSEGMKRDKVLDSPIATRLFLQATLRDFENEVFGVLMLDSQHRVITFEVLFQGTVDQSVVYPREIIKKILKYNATAVIIVHNHPSGIPTPSESDVLLTKRLYHILCAIDVKLLDHLIVGDNTVFSLVEQGIWSPA
ncbi:MAG: DNA repair protein RadC [Legionellales bacterium]|nr:DNA repair protein RadC [Legionellales bacterium]